MRWLIVLLVLALLSEVAQPSVAALAQASETMDAQEIVLAAMDALWAMDIDGYLAYLADDVVVTGTQVEQSVYGKEAYLQTLLPLRNIPDVIPLPESRRRSRTSGRMRPLTLGESKRCRPYAVRWR